MVCVHGRGSRIAGAAAHGDAGCRGEPATCRPRPPSCGTLRAADHEGSLPAGCGLQAHPTAASRRGPDGRRRPLDDDRIDAGRRSAAARLGDGQRRTRPRRGPRRPSPSSLVAAAQDLALAVAPLGRPTPARRRRRRARRRSSDDRARRGRPAAARHLGPPVEDRGRARRPAARRARPAARSSTGPTGARIAGAARGTPGSAHGIRRPPRPLSRAGSDDRRAHASGVGRRRPSTAQHPLGRAPSAAGRRPGQQRPGRAGRMASRAAERSGSSSENTSSSRSTGAMPTVVGHDAVARPGAGPGPADRCSPWRRGCGPAARRRRAPARRGGGRPVDTPRRRSSSPGRGQGRGQTARRACHGES